MKTCSTSPDPLQQVLVLVAEKREHECYQQQDGAEAVEDVVLVGEVASPAEGEDLHPHLQQVVEDEDQVDDLKETRWGLGLSQREEDVKPQPSGFLWGQTI